MGLFSSRKKTIVGTTVSRAIEDKAMPNATKTAVLSAIFSKDDPDILNHVLEELTVSIGLRAERMYEYGRTHYTHGLPSGQYKAATLGRAEVEAVLASVEGSPVLVNYCHYGSANNLHVGWMRVIELYGYDPATNQIASLTTAKGTPVYLKDMVVVVPAATADQNPPGSLDQWGQPATAGYTPERKWTSGPVGLLRSHSPVYQDPTATEEYIRVVYVWVTREAQANQDGVYSWVDVVHEENLTIPITGFNDEDDYFHVKYSVNGITKYWMYLDGAGTYPTLDQVFIADESAGTFFPFAYFRYNKTSEIADKTTEAYKTSKKLVKYLGMDYDMVAEAVDENPDIADVEQAMLVMAVPANTENELERRYLFDFFDSVYSSAGLTYTSQSQASLHSTLEHNADLPRSSIIIQDRRFKMALSNGGIFKTRVAGTIGPTGSHTSGIIAQEISQTYMQRDEFTGSESPFTVITPVNIHYYRRQISAGRYDEIQIVNLEMRYHIWGKYTTTGDETDAILLVPIDRAITSNYSIPDREILYARSLHYVFNSRIVQKIKWYQTGFFQVIMIVVAVVLTIYSMGSSLEGLAAALATGSGAAIAAAAWTLLVQILTGLVIAVALKLFVKAVGVKLAFIIAVVVAIYGGYQAIQAGSLKGAPWAEECLALSTGLSNAVTSVIGDNMEDLMGKAQDFSKYVAEQTKLLDEAKRLLEGNNLLSPFVIFGESPDNFYNRTVHAGNIGIVGIDAISNYVDMSLTLPKLDETIGATPYVLSY